MPDRRVPGRSVVTRRAIIDIVRPAVSGSYGVLGFTAPNLWSRILRVVGAHDTGIRVSFHDGIVIDLHLSVAYGLPVAEVARQADSAVRYAIRRALDREVARLTIHVGGLRFQAPAAPPAPTVSPPAPAPATAAIGALATARNGQDNADGSRRRRRRRGRGDAPATSAAPVAPDDVRRRGGDASTTGPSA